MPGNVRQANLGHVQGKALPRFGLALALIDSYLMQKELQATITCRRGDRRGHVTGGITFPPPQTAVAQRMCIRVDHLGTCIESSNNARATPRRNGRFGRFQLEGKSKTTAIAQYPSASCSWSV